MALRIRLKRAGNRKRPFYRVVVIESKNARDSRSVEDLGYYDPLEAPTVFNVNRERAAYWIERGAQMSDTVGTLMKSENTAHASRRNVPAFTGDAPEVRRPKKGEGEGERPRGKRPARAAKAESAVAVAEPPVVEEAPVAEPTPAAEPTEAPAAEAAAPEAPAAEAPADEKTEG